MKQILVVLDGMATFRKLWVTFDESPPDGFLTGKIHKRTEDILLGFGQLAKEGRMFAFQGILQVPVTEITREGRITIKLR